MGTCWCGAPWAPARNPDLHRLRLSAHFPQGTAGNFRGPGCASHQPPVFHFTMPAQLAESLPPMTEAMACRPPAIPISLACTHCCYRHWSGRPRQSSEASGGRQEAIQHQQLQAPGRTSWARRMKQTSTQIHADLACHPSLSPQQISRERQLFLHSWALLGLPDQAGSQSLQTYQAQPVLSRGMTRGNSPLAGPWNRPCRGRGDKPGPNWQLTGLRISVCPALSRNTGPMNPLDRQIELGCVSVNG